MSTMLAEVERRLQARVAENVEMQFEQLRRQVRSVLLQYSRGYEPGLPIKQEAVDAFIEPMRAEILKREQDRVSGAFFVAVAEAAERS